MYNNYYNICCACKITLFSFIHDSLGANHRFEKEQEFRIIEKMALNPSPKDRVKL
ncbi:hypothetical protein AAID92_06030 [Campylobacter coli]